MKKLILSLLLVFPFLLAKGQVTVEAFLFDKTGTATNIRQVPGGKVKTQLPQDDDYCPLFSLISCNNGWWKIADCSDAYSESGIGTERCKKAVGGYIHYSCVGIYTRNYANEPISLHAKPSASAKVVYLIEKEMLLHPTGVSKTGDWVKVKTMDGKHEGWIPSEWLCSNPLTNCC